MLGGPTYDEARQFAYFMDVFTPRELAGAMRVPVEAVEGFVIGLVRNGTVAVVDNVNGGRWEDDVLEFVPLPRGPRFRPRLIPPERATPGAYDLAPPRGMPVASRAGRGQYSRIGLRRPGRRQMRREDRIMRLGS